MATELQKKYEAQFFQISGFSCIAPFGKLVLNAFHFKLIDLNIFICVYFIVSVSLAYCGMLLILHGYEVLGERKSIWTQE